MSAIPVVDFSSLSMYVADDKLNDSDVQSTADEMINAFTTIGFVYLSNTGFPQQLLEDVDSEGGKFFELSETTKLRYGYGADNHGWTAMEQERLNAARPGDLKECFDVTFKAMHDDSRWPTAEIPNFKHVMVKCFEACSKLTLRVLLAIARGLKMKDVNYFVRCHADIARPGDKTMSCLRLLKYPQLLSLADVKPNQVRLGEHTDYGSITLLFQRDIGGLQVKSPDGQWIDAVPMANTVVVNIADLLQRWTADRLLSTSHRVMIPEDERERLKVRRSLVFFANPDADVTVTCVDGSDKYPPVNSAEYHYERIHSTYTYIHDTAT